ncbi:uncharacterized protein LOC143374904 [Andrena cerasifolii]|uniref:uncharacterized protein LOC143374904 n=1 Tax=Andrena cerasifolii TaxID=2819439 RepID=UPI00403794AF
MQILRRLCILLTVCGFSRPPTWTSKSKRFLYDVYTICVFMVLYALVVFELLDLVLVVDNQDDFSDNFYVTLSMFVTCIKMWNLLFTRRNIALLFETLQEEPFLPLDTEEMEIRSRFDGITEWNTIAYMILIESCMLFMFVASLFTDLESRKLTLRVWLPYDHTSTLGFTLTYVHQVMGATVCSLSTVACDSLFSSLLIHIYTQFEILGHRLRNIESDGTDSVRLCAHHHKEIYKFAAMVNEEFKTIMFVQFLTSTSTICFDLYRIMQKDSDSRLVDIAFYASCTLTQIFYYCWYGNEVKLKSLEIPDMIFASNWTSLSNSSKKILLMIMKRAMEPVEFTSYYLVSMCLESFKALLKTSYSAFNLLQQTKLKFSSNEYVGIEEASVRSTMYLLRWVYTFLTASGCLASPSWAYPYKTFLFNVYTVIVVMLVHTLIISQILDAVFVVDNEDDFSENFYVTMPMIVTSFKLCSLLASRRNIAILISALQKEPFVPMNTEEIEIQVRFNKLAEWNAIGYVISVEMCVAWMSLTRYTTDFKSEKLIVRAWLPYDYSTSVPFNFTYLYQFFALTVASFVNVACDTLFGGLLIHAYSQFEILGHRLQNINRNGNNYLVKECARHHSHIYKFTAMVNKEFTIIVFVQFLASISLLCFEMYRITQQNLGSRFMETVLYGICVLTQIFYYCWFGNEVKLKSFEVPDMIFSSNWISLTTNTKRILLMIMRRATIPVEITSGNIVPMNLEAFKTIVGGRMHKLSLSFALLTYSGFWRPTTWPVCSLKYWLYNAYSVVMVLILYTFTFCAMVDSVTSKDLKTMTDKFSLFISVFGVCFKVANLFLKREKIIGMVNVLLKGNCVPRDEQEAIIQRKFDDYARKLTIYCEILNEAAAWFVTVGQFEKILSTRTLPAFDWVPYNMSSNELYIMSVLHQTIALMMCANASVSNETLIAGLMIQVGAQFEIFCHRAQILPVSLMLAERESTSEADFKNRRKRILGEFIEHHLEVYKFARTVNTIFQYMIFLQFSISSTVLCLTIYKTSSMDSFDVDMIGNFSYLCCMLMQVYLYCWFGNEVTLKSTKAGDAIYEMDWTVLPVNVMKDLLIIMTRTKRTLQMSSGHVVTLSTGSFMSIMKITYSSYNILKDSS